MHESRYLALQRAKRSSALRMPNEYLFLACTNRREWGSSASGEMLTHSDEQHVWLNKRDEKCNWETGRGWYLLRKGTGFRSKIEDKQKSGKTGEQNHCRRPICEGFWRWWISDDDAIAWSEHKNESERNSEVSWSVYPKASNHDRDAWRDEPPKFSMDKAR